MWACVSRSKSTSTGLASLGKCARAMANYTLTSVWQLCWGKEAHRQDAGLACEVPGELVWCGAYWQVWEGCKSLGGFVKMIIVARHWPL